ncbi:sensor histidine kinase [Maricaulis virginensis]|jgi:sensor histidine kinase YesM|uniref:Histidine kinase domain-containing protein n=1 Tax=Maricaulis virginensis TaxID=144022 RepID=A0A9W6IJ46_9PROT|nr:histidine kinase [Maricaulis virginensis]GLK50873.1 hypothetical protein GCM10017621_03810 [Maricaulis virginensis]
MFSAPPLSPAPDAFRSDRLAARHLAIALILFWCVIAFFNLVADWNEFVARPGLLPRLVPVSTAGGLLSFMLTDLIRRTRELPAVRRFTTLIIAIAATALVFSVVNLLFTAREGTGGIERDMLTRVGQRWMMDVWVFAGWCALTWRLDQSRRPDPARQRGLQSRLNRTLGSANRLPTTTIDGANDGMRAAVFWRMQIVFWTCNLLFTVLTSIAMIEDVYNLWRNVVIEASGLAATTLIHYAVLRPTRQLDLSARFALIMGSSMLATCFYIVMMWLMWYEVFPTEFTNSRMTTRGWEGLTHIAPRWFVFNMPAFIAWSAIYLVIEAFGRIRAQEWQLYDSAVLAQEAQLKMLRFQLNPHFLFNTINAISSLVIDRHNDEAETMLGRLSDFLRFALQTSPDERVPLDEELAAQDLYLGIEKARFDSRLEVERDIDPAVRKALVPSLILQPVLENSVKYAVSRSRVQVHIAIRARREGEMLVLDITDSGGPVPATPPEGTGVGLNNIRARLEVLYGRHADLAAGPVKGGGFAVRIRLPLEVGEPVTAAATETDTGQTQGGKKDAHPDR